jgi:hypothetical protein
MHIHLTKNTNNRFDIEGLNDPGIEKNGKFLKGINGYEGPLAKIFGWFLVLIGKAIYLQTDAGFALANKRSTENFLKRVFKQLPSSLIDLKTLKFNDSNWYENLILIAKSAKQLKENTVPVNEQINQINNPKPTETQTKDNGLILEDLVKELPPENNEENLNIERSIEEFAFAGNEVKDNVREFVNLIPGKTQADIPFRILRDHLELLKNPQFFELFKTIPENLRIEYFEIIIHFFRIPDKIEDLIDIFKNAPNVDKIELVNKLFNLLNKIPANTDEFHLYPQTVAFVSLFPPLEKLKILDMFEEDLRISTIENRRSLINLMTAIPENQRVVFAVEHKDLLIDQPNLINQIEFILKQFSKEDRVQAFVLLKDLTPLSKYEYEWSLIHLLEHTPKNHRLDLIKEILPLLKELNDSAELFKSACTLLTHLDYRIRKQTIENLLRIIQNNPQNFAQVLNQLFMNAREQYGNFRRIITIE